MSRWCRVENGVVVWGPGSLPQAYDNISNFHLLSDGELRARGWRPYRFIETALSGQIIVASTTDIYADEVVETQIARDPTPEEIADQNRLPVPEEVALWKFRAALKIDGDFERVQQALAQPSSAENILAAELFEYGNSVYRQSTLTDTIVRILRVSEEEIDSLFRRASEIRT